MAVAEFQKKASELMRQVSGASRKISEARERLRHLEAALKQTPKATPGHFARWNELEEKLAGLQMRLSGDPVRQGLNESTPPSISGRVQQVASGHWRTRQLPTKAHQENIEIATLDFAQFREGLRAFLQELEQYEADLEAAGAPYTSGRKF